MARRWLEYRGDPTLIRYVRAGDPSLRRFSVDGKDLDCIGSESTLVFVYREITDPDHIAALELAYPEV